MTKLNKIFAPLLCLMVLMIGLISCDEIKGPKEDTQTEQSEGESDRLCQHLFGDWTEIKAASCVESGSEYRECNNCDYTETREIHALDHNYSTEWTVDVQPTSSTGGIQSHHCTRCDDKIDITEIPATGSIGLAYQKNPDGKTCTIVGMGTCKDTELYFPNEIDGLFVTGICTGAFSRRQDITGIVIPENITYIGCDAFYGCSKLKTIAVKNGNETYCAVNNCLIETATKKLVLGCKTSVIPNDGSVESIGEFAFAGSDLKALSIPNKITSIGYSAFIFCDDLKKLEIPNSVTQIGPFAFGQCSSLEELIIPNSVTSVGTGAFNNCSALSTVTVGNGVTAISDQMFQLCTSLTSISLPANLTVIGDDAFASCHKLNTVVIPPNVTHIGKSAFSGCNNFTSISIPASVASIGEGAFNFCYKIETVYIANLEAWLTGKYPALHNTCQNYHILDDSKQEATKLIVPEGITSIRDYAFSYFENIESIVISDRVTDIGVSAFQWCSRLKTLTFGNSVNTIGCDAFYACKELTSIILPGSVKTINDFAFMSCENLTHVFYDGNADDWSNIYIGDWNDPLDSATIFYFSANTPIEDGNFWHYVDGVPTPW